MSANKTNTEAAYHETQAEMRRLIDRSISHDEIVTADWSADLSEALRAECSDHIEASRTVHEFWGGLAEEGSDDSEWRVHLIGERSASARR